MLQALLNESDPYVALSFGNIETVVVVLEKKNGALSCSKAI